MAKVFVGKDFVEDAVGVPRCATADEFAIGCSKRVENGVVEVLVISHEIKLICVHYIKGWASDCFRVVGKCLNAASIGKIDFGFLWLKSNACWELMGECCYAGYDSFGLTPRGSYYCDCRFWMGNRIFEEKCRDGFCFAALPTPSCSRKLVVLKNCNEFFLVCIGFKI